MVSFISKKINEEINPGTTLKEARERGGLTIDRVSAILGINAKYLTAFEESNEKDLPEGVYADKFLKRYAQFLGLDEKIFLSFSLRDKKVIGNEKQKTGKESPVTKIKNFIFHPTFLKSAIALLVLLLGTFYLFSTVYKIVKAPKLTIVQPNDDLITSQYSVEIEGETESEAKIYINNKEIFCSTEGGFEERVDLKKGLNVVKITAKKKYSKENVLYRKILVEDDKISVK